LNSHHSPLNDTFIINNKTTSDKSIIANKFNEFFVNVGPSLANKIPPSDISYLTYMKGNFTKSFGLVETNANEVISIVKCFNTKHYDGYDDIQNDIMKLSIHFTANILSKIINKSFMEAKYQIYLKLLKSALFSKMETNPSSLTTVSYLCYQAFRKYLRKLFIID